MDQADDFLHQPILSLPAPGDDIAKKDRHNQSQQSFTSNMTGMTSLSHKTNFLALNKERARDYNPYRKPMICDTLDEPSKNRLLMLTEDIDGDLDQFIKQKDEYYALVFDDKTSLAGMKSISDPDNAYLYTKNDVDRIERINESLMKVAPMLPPSDANFDYDPPTHSALKSKLGDNHYKSEYDHSKFLDDKQSVRSLPMSTATRKSNLTMLTHQTFKSGFQQLPRDKKLREVAEKRMLKNQLRDIDQNLKNISNTDDLSYANNNNSEEMKGQLQV